MKPSKTFKDGDIVYWCHQCGHKYTVRFGMVNTLYSYPRAIYVDYLVPRERRIVNGIPIDEFQPETRYQKLPKGWTYDTQLYQITYDELSEEEKDIDITNPNAIKDAYTKGYIVKKENVFCGYVDEDITKDGYRLIKKYYSNNEDAIYSTTLIPSNLYLTYQEALEIVEKHTAVFYQQAEMSEYDWSVKEINKTLEHYKVLAQCSDREIQRYRDWILKLDKIEDIETRVFQRCVQWKHLKNQRWNTIELSVDIEALIVEEMGCNDG